MKMPDPIGSYDVTHIGPFRSRLIDVTETSLQDGKYDIFTTEQMKQYGRDLLEEAARLCDAEENELHSSNESRGTAEHFGRAIRKLNETL